ETGLRFIDRIARAGRRSNRSLALGIGARPGLPLPALEVLTQLCGQSLLTQGGLFGFAHDTAMNRVWSWAVDRRFLALRIGKAYGKGAAFALPNAGCCCSSVVEHSLGKGEADSSILSSSTIFFPGFPLIQPPA